jgi:hypothetical protein
MNPHPSLIEQIDHIHADPENLLYAVIERRDEDHLAGLVHHVDNRKYVASWTYNPELTLPVVRISLADLSAFARNAELDGVMVYERPENPAFYTLVPV